MAHLLCLDWMDPLPLAHFPLIYRRHSTWTQGKDVLASKGKIWHLYLTMFFKWAIYNSTEIINNHSFCHSQIKCLFCKIPFFEDPGWECICKRLNGSWSSSLFSSLLGLEDFTMVKGSFGWCCSNWVCTDCSKTVSEKSFLCDSWKNPLFFCFLCSARRNLIMIEAGIPGNAWERGVCTQLCLGAW